MPLKFPDQNKEWVTVTAKTNKMILLLTEEYFTVTQHFE